MSYIPQKLRDIVIDRANSKCEYCSLHQRYAGSRHEVDHIIVEKHGGKTTDDNLCLCCKVCNRHKGSDLASIDWDYDEALAALFHPRQQKWSEHFEQVAGEIVARTAEGRVTVFLLQFNHADRLNVRQRLFKLGRYP